MSKLLGAGSNKNIFARSRGVPTSTYNTGSGSHDQPTSASHQTVPNTQAAGKLVQNLTDTVATRYKIRFLLRLGTYGSLVSTASIPSLSKARDAVTRILDRGRGKDEPVEGEGSLVVKDSRSGKTYDIPIRNGSIQAMAFRQITTPKFSILLGRPMEGSLKVLDIGYQNTACTESSITYV
jgi:hypothetical protein